MVLGLLAARMKHGQAPSANVHTLPAPVGGWNARDSLSAMKPEDAIVLDNIIPDLGRVRGRSGFAEHATGIPDDYVESLMEYSAPDGTIQMFAASPGDVHDITSAGEVSDTPAISGLSNGRWQHTMFSALGGNYLCMVNGADGYYTYDGTTWTDQTINVSGADATDFVNIAIHASRLWFVEKDTLDAWYLPTASITGEATKFPLGPMCRLGGYLLAIGTWTKDGGDGMDDYAVFITSRGEVIVYQGTDPSSALTWTRVGVFRISEPVGRRCVIKVGGDIGIITASGVALLSQLVGVNLSGQRKVTISNKISKAFTDAYRTSFGNHGWQIVEYPSQNLVIVNVPVSERMASYQFVVNVETGGWCRFTGINALCWSRYGDKLLFGGADGKVYQFGAESDNGEPIPWRLQMAYNKCGGSNNKVFTMVRPLLITVPGYRPGIALSFNYDTTPANPPAPLATGEGSYWDEAEWDVASWGTDTEDVSLWQSVAGEGRSVSVAMAGRSLEAPIEFNEIDVMFERAGWL